METVSLTPSHWFYLATVLFIFIAIAFRRGVIIPSIVGVIGLGLLSGNGDETAFSMILRSTQILFAALLNSGVALFDIMLLIAIMVAMLSSLKAQGADQMMVAPMKKIMVGPRSAFFSLSLTIYVAAVFFWPTPAIALVGTVLIPVAIRVGLPAMGAAVAVNLAGHGMALSADPVIQGATRLTSNAANIDPGDLLPYTILFSFTTGGVAIAISCYKIWRDMRLGRMKAEPTSDNDDHPHANGPYAKHFGVGVPIILLCIVGLMIYRGIFDPENAIRGGDATALLGGVATVLLVMSTLAHEGIGGFDKIAEHIKTGFFFCIKIFAPIIPIAAFFFLGNPDHAVTVMGDGTSGYLFDIGRSINAHMGANSAAQAVGIAITGVLVGLDGSGFSGLPLLGSLTGALAGGDVNNTVVLSALAQVITIFTGGGTLVAWAFGVCADAGISGVSPASLVRRNFFPVMAGFTTTTFLAIILMS